MKKIKEFSSKALLLTIVLSMCFSVYALGADEWQSVFAEDFSSMSEGAIASSYITELKGGFTAEIEDEELNIRSENLCFWEINDTTGPDAKKNCVEGLTPTALNVPLVKHDPPFVTDDASFDYTGGATGCWAIEEVGGKNALMIGSFPAAEKKNGAWNYRTNDFRFIVSEGLFPAIKKKYNVSVDIYFPQGKKPSFVYFQYWNGTKSAKVQTSSSQIAAMPEGEWTTWNFEIEADLSKPGKIYSSAPAFSFYITQANYTYSYTDRSYIRKISIKEKPGADYEYCDTEKTVMSSLEIDGVYGNTKTSFDMTLPLYQKFTNEIMFNSGNNSMRAVLKNENKIDVAAVQIDSADGVQKIYAISGDSETKNLLYEGDIKGESINYQMEVDWKAKTYCVGLDVNGSPIDQNNESYGPFDIMNGSSVVENVLVRYIAFKHNKASEALMTTIDNIEVSYIEDPDYQKCKEDAQNLTLDIPENGIVTDGFELPTAGETSGAEITWASSNPEVLTISADNSACTLTRGSERADVTLTATFELNGVTVLREFELVVEKHTDKIKTEEDVAAIDFAPGDGSVVENGFALATEGELNGSVITWVSSNPEILAITADNSACTLTRGSEREEITLTATAKINGFSSATEFKVVVEKHEYQLQAEEDAAAIKLNISASGRAKENFELDVTGKINAGLITWESSGSAVIIDGSTARVTRAETDTDVILTATVNVNGYSTTRTFNVTVATLVGVNSKIGEVSETISGGYLSANVAVSYPGRSGSLNFAAIVTDPETGMIIGKDVFTKELTSADSFGTVVCSVDNVPIRQGDTVSYYIWDENNESFVNNSPSAVTKLTADGKARGVRLNWEEADDDYKAIEYYKVYRDGQYIGDALDETYLDPTTEYGKTYSYEIVPVDTNSLIGGAAEKASTPMLQMYYISYDKKGKGETEFTYGMDDFEFRLSGDRRAWIEEVTDADGEKCFAATSDEKWIIGCTDKDYIGGDVTDMVFEVVYLDTTGSIQMVHNQIIPPGKSDSTTYARKSLTPIVNMEGTNLWKTAVFEISDANFRNSSYWSAADFGFHATVNGKMFIKEIRIIQADLYN